MGTISLIQWDSTLIGDGRHVPLSTLRDQHEGALGAVNSPLDTSFEAFY